MELNQVKKILIINLGGIGDLLLSLPAVSAIRQHYNKGVDCSFDIVVVRRSVEIMKGTGLFNNVYMYNKKFYVLIKLLWKLRKVKYDLVVNMRTIASGFGAPPSAGLRGRLDLVVLR